MALWIETFPGLGSDRLVRLDGRFGLARAHREGAAYVRQLRRVKPWLEGYTIMRGERPSALFALSLPVHVPSAHQAESGQ